MHRLIIEALSINTFYQLVGEIKKTRYNIENTRRKIQEKVVTKTGQKAADALFKYSKEHPRT